MSDHTLLLGGAERKHTRVRGACDCGPAPSPLREAAWPSWGMALRPAVAMGDLMPADRLGRNRGSFEVIIGRDVDVKRGSPVTEWPITPAAITRHLCAEFISPPSICTQPKSHAVLAW